MSEQILKILKSHGEQLATISTQVEANSTELKSHGEQLKSHGEQLDLIASTVVGHEERLLRIEENMVTKKDHQEVMGTLDKLVGMMEKRDQEITMISHGMRRLDERVEKLELFNKKVEPLLLGLS